MATGMANLIKRSRQEFGDKPDLLPEFYQTALQSYWNGDSQTAAKIVADILATEPDAPSLLQAYRLWIEILAEASDYESLRALERHLRIRSQAGSDHQMSYLALRTIIRLELDEYDAAKLYCLGMSADTSNSYVAEAIARVELRTSLAADAMVNMVTCKSPLVDYFHWQTLVKLASAAGCQETIAHGIQFIGTIFPQSTFPSLFEYHNCIEAELFGAAGSCAENLCQRYPEQTEFAYLKAYATFHDGDFATAKSLLIDLCSRNESEDTDCIELLGRCYVKLGENELAKRHLQRVASILQNQGLPTSHVQRELERVEEELRGEDLDPSLLMPRLTRMWLVTLSPRRYHELLTSPESDVDELLRPMGELPKSGDFCFFASAKESSSKWKIAAIYAVDSHPVWHPTQGHESALRLVCRPREGIPVDVEMLSQSDESLTVVDSSADEGIYELEVGALDVITNAVRRHNAVDEDAAMASSTAGKVS